MNIQDARRLSPAAQEALRRRAVGAVLSGKTQVEVARLFGVSTESMRKWMRLYERGGDRALKIRRRGRPSRIKLEPWQAAQTVRTVTERQPDQVKLPWALWTREAVAQLIANRFGVRLSRWTAGRYLKRWGFTPQKPLRRAFEQDPEAVRRWLETEYPRIRLQAKGEDAEIHWGDETGVRSDHQTGQTWGRKGQTPVVPGTGRRFGCNMISSITNRGTLRFMIFRRRFNAGVFLIFLGRLIRSTDRKVYLIVDRHPAHKARKVERWLDEHQERIRMFYLPPYSPELNPDERLNQDVKSNAVGRRRSRTLSEMLQNLRGYLRSTQKRPDIVKSYFQDQSVRYAAL